MVFTTAAGCQCRHRTRPTSFAEWIRLADEAAISLVVCVAAAQRRGILDAGEAEREGLDANNLHPAFQLAGLGVLTESVIDADRFISFG